MRLDPTQGGCWFCHTDDDKGDWCFTMEFDANFHMSCLVAALEPDRAMLHPEAEIIGREHDLLPASPAQEP